VPVAAEQERVAGVQRYRFTVDEFMRMGEAGIFTGDDRVELIDGEILEMTPIGSLHAGLVSRLNELIVTRPAGKAYVGIQNPVRLDHHTEPQPDLVVARRRESFYTDRHPEPGDILLIIEVADSSLRYDRLEKVPRYGKAGVPETWLVDVDAVIVAAYTGPCPDGYANRQVRHRGDEIVATRAPEIRLSVDDIFAHLESSTTVPIEPL
jgi:Uma2 family endonuclease